jgi:hypothetical protein
MLYCLGILAPSLNKKWKVIEAALLKKYETKSVNIITVKGNVFLSMNI